MGEKYSNVTLYVQPVNKPLTLLNSLENIEIIMYTNDNPYKEAIIGFDPNQEYEFTGNIRLSYKTTNLDYGFLEYIKKFI